MYLTDRMTNRRNQQLFSHYWLSSSGEEERCLVFLSHGFSEHLGLYQEVGEYLSELILVLEAVTDNYHIMKVAEAV